MEFQELIFTNFADEYTYKKHMACFINQLGSGQDHGLVGTTIDEQGIQFDYLFTFDGHGLNPCINHIRNMDLHSVVSRDNPLERIKDRLHLSMRDFYRSGSTAIVTKIYKDHILIEYMGDSQVAVFIDGKMVYISEPHTLQNAAEVERIQPLLNAQLPIEITTKPALVSKDRMAMVEGNRCYFKCGSMIAPTQALGHNGGTGFAPTKKRIEFNPEQHVRIVSASDGLWDMIFLEDPSEVEELLTLSHQELMDKAERRWKQDWRFSEDKDETDPSKIFTTNFGGGYDDITISIWDNKYAK
jgi:serine/threonine protein phosphatase PrpC